MNTQKGVLLRLGELHGEVALHKCRWFPFKPKEHATENISSCIL